MISLTKILKGLRITVSGTTTPAAIEITPAGSASTTTTVTSSQTANRTLTLPDETGTVLSTASTIALSQLTAVAVNKALASDSTGHITTSTTTDAELSYVAGVTSSIQTQLNAKGTVNSISVVTANGFSGSVANPSTTPAITLSTTASGILKGAAGALASASVGDFPTLNQNTTGTAAGLSTTLAISSGGTNATSAPVAFQNLSPITSDGDLIVGGPGGAPQRLAAGASGYVLTSTGTSSPPAWSPNSVIATPYAVPTIQKFTSSSGTYNKNYTFIVSSANATVGALYTQGVNTYTVNRTVSSSTQVILSGAVAPTASGTLTLSSGTGDPTITYTQFLAPLYLQVKMVGGGGGGAGSGSGGGSGSDGTATTFGSSFLIANQGSGGQGTSGAGGAGGSASALPSGVFGSSLAGGGGGGYVFTNISGTTFAGAMGGSSALGGGGRSTNGNGAAGSPNTGGGGSGAANNPTSNVSTFTGNGGGAGAYICALVYSPALTYLYSVGTGGGGGTAGGSSGSSGGAGGSGYIEVTEFYQ